MATLTIPPSVCCFFGWHDPLMTRGDLPLVVVWICRHCLRELGRTDILVPPRITMTPLKVERLRNLIRRTNDAEARRRGE